MIMKHALEGPHALLPHLSILCVQCFTISCECEKKCKMPAQVSSSGGAASSKRIMLLQAATQQQEQPAGFCPGVSHASGSSATASGPVSMRAS